MEKIRQKLYNSGIQILRIGRYRLRFYSDWMDFCYSDPNSNTSPLEKTITWGFFTLTIRE